MVDGRHQEHWLEAEKQIDKEEAGDKINPKPALMPTKGPALDQGRASHQAHEAETIAYAINLDVDQNLDNVLRVATAPGPDFPTHVKPDEGLKVKPRESGIIKDAVDDIPAPGFSLIPAGRNTAPAGAILNYLRRFFGRR